MSCVSVWNTSIKSHVVGGYAKGTLWSIRSNPPLSDWSDLKVLVDQGQNFGKWRVMMMMTILWWMLALRRGANFYKNWSKVEFPTNLRNKAAPPPPGGHPSIHHVESSSKTAFFSFFLLAGVHTGMGRVGVEANTDAACWQIMGTSQLDWQRDGKPSGHCGHYGGQSVGQLAWTKKTQEKIIGHCGHCGQKGLILVLHFCMPGACVEAEYCFIDQQSTFGPDGDQQQCSAVE